MIKISISNEQIERAKSLYPFDCLNNSITKGKSNLFGALGEVIVYDYFKGKKTIDFTSTYDYDMIIDKHKVDIKTKKTTVVPKEYYLCSISASNIKQNCDYYFFVRIKEDFKTGYLLGYINKDKFYQEAIFKTKGDLDINNFIFKDDCYNLEISKLNKFKDENIG